jgi:hypothetical protein
MKKNCENQRQHLHDLPTKSRVTQVSVAKKKMSVLLFELQD